MRLMRGSPGLKYFSLATISIEVPRSWASSL
jgi:hypothetical protein